MTVLSPLSAAAGAVTAPPLRVAVLVASTRPGRLGPTVAAWFVGCAAQHDRTQDVPLDVDLVDLADHAVPGRVLSERVAAADAVVVVVPEYNHSFPGPFKTAVDSLRAEWFAKPVAFVSYGGLSGGLRAVEALRLVFAELHAVTLREAVALPTVWDDVDAHGVLQAGEPAQAAADRLLVHLRWWATALRDARLREPYVA